MRTRATGVDGILARAIDAVRVNVAWREERDGRPAWVKRRGRGAGAVIVAGNVFLAQSNSRIRMFARVDAWRRWERECFDLLNGDSYGSGDAGPRGVWTHEVPGESIRELAIRAGGAVEERVLVAAAREFAGVHALVCPLRRAPWSHGDPHPGNVLYNPAGDRCRLIDFETAHEPGLPAVERHADDLLTFLLELLARSPDDRWPAAGERFLLAYGDAATTRAVADRLTWPAGRLERVLWRTRTAHRPTDYVTARLESLRRAVR